MKTTRTKKRTTMRRNNRLQQVVLCLLCTVIALPSLAAPGDKKLGPRDPYALIFGTVFGPDDRPVRGVKVKIRRAAEKKPVELLSDARGEFAQRFPAGPADYLVWADLKDKQAAQNTQVKVHVDNDERQDVTLHLTKQSTK